MEYSIATPADWPGVTECIAATGYYAPIDASTLDGVLIVAREKGKVIGCAWLMHCGRHGYLDYLAVHPDHQGKDVARSLLAACRLVAEEMGVEYVRMAIYQDNEAAAKLLQENAGLAHGPYWLGFVRVGA